MVRKEIKDLKTNKIKRFLSLLLGLSILLSMAVPAFALDTPEGGASIFIDDVRVEAKADANPAQFKIEVKFDPGTYSDGRTATIPLTVSAAATGITSATPASVANKENLEDAKLGIRNSFIDTGNGTIVLIAKTGEAHTEFSATIEVPNLTATTPITINRTGLSISAKTPTSGNNTQKVPADKIEIKTGSIIVQYPVTVTVEGDTTTGGSIAVNTKEYNGKNTFDRNGTSTPLTTGQQFWVDSGAGQQNAPTLDVTAPAGNYKAEYKVGNGAWQLAGDNFSIGEVTAATNVSIRYTQTTADTVTVTVTDKYGKYDLGTWSQTGEKHATNKATVNAKPYTGYTAYAYILDNNAQVNGTSVEVPLDDNHTVTFLYKRSDNSAVVPGKDGNFGNDDDVVIKPNDPDKTPTVDDTTGAVTVPNDTTGTVTRPKDPTNPGNGKEDIVVPGGTTVDKDGTINLPGGGKVEPGTKLPDNTPAGYVTVTYRANTVQGGTGEDVMQIGKDFVQALGQQHKSTSNRQFLNWNTQESGKGTKYEENDKITQNEVLFAQWSDAPYTESVEITFNSNLDGVTAEKQTIGVYAGTSSTENLRANSFALDGWTFGGWSDQQIGEIKYTDGQPYTFNKGDANTLNLYAQWYKQDGSSITVPGPDGIPGNANDATAVGSGTKAPERDGTTGIITIPAGGNVTTNDGKTEYPMPDGGTLKPDGTITITQPGDGPDIIVKPGEEPKLEPEDATKKVIKITYASGIQGVAAVVMTAVVDKNGGTTKIVSGEKLFSREDYKFAYWKNANDKIIAVGSDQGESITLTANWYAVDKDGNITVPKNPGEVVVKPNPNPNPTDPDKKPEVDDNGNVVVPPGGEVETQPDGGTTTLPDGGKVTPGGEIVVPDPDKPNDPYNPGKPINPNDHTTWPDGYYAVVYEKNGANATGTMAKQIGTKLVALANGFTNGDLKFLAWNTKTDGTGSGYKPGVAIPAPGAEVTDKTITLYAVWGKVGADGSITVPGKDGSVDPDTDSDNVTVKPGEGGGKPEVDDNGNVKVPDGGTVKKEPDGSEITPPGGSVVTPGGEILVPDPENPGGTIPIDPDNPDSLPEGWYVVEYLANDASATGTMPKQVSKDVVKAKDNRFDLPGNTFTEWNTKPNGIGGVRYEPGDDVAKPADGSKTVILYAQWRSSTVATFEVNVRFYKDIDHSETKTQLVTGTGSQTTANLDANTFTLAGWTFLGWSTKPDGTGTFYANNAPVVFQNDANTLELYAIWYKQDGDNIVIPGPDGKPDTGDDITIKPDPGNPDGEKPVPDQGGTIKVPNGGQIVIPGPNTPDGDKTITVEPDATVTPDGTITLPEGGTATIEPGGTTVGGPAVIKPDGTVENPDTSKPYRPGDGTIIVPGKDEVTDTPDDVVVRPNPGSDGNDNSTIDKDTGNVTLPDGGKVEYPDGTTVTVPGGTVVKPDGTVVLPDDKGGTITPPGGPETELPGGTEIGPNGKIRYPYTVKFVGVSRADEIVKIESGMEKRIDAPAISGYTVDKESVTVIGGDLIDGGYIIIFTYTQNSGGNTGGGGSGGGSTRPTKPTIKDDEDKDPTKNPETNVTLPEFTGVADWLKTDVHDAYMTGVGNGLFAPNANMTRAQVAQMFYNLLKDKSASASTTFSDVPSDAWYTEAVNTLAALGIIGGSNGKFRPNDPITRAEFVAIAMRFASTVRGAKASFSDVSRDAWYYESIANAVEYGWIGGYADGTFRPNKPITRAEVVSITNRMLNRSFDTDVRATTVTRFTDVATSHWAFAAIAEATTSHDHTFKNGVESWDW